MKEIIIASNNKGKIKEAQEILKQFKVISMEEIGIKIDVEEDQETFEGNDYGWYDDDSLLGNAGYPWFVKGGYYGLTLNSGIFSTRNFYGYIYNPVSSRLVVVN